jgi:hypothetical protein
MSFTITADLSIINAAYSITAGIDVADDNLTNNTLTSIFYNRNDVPLHTNTNGFAISRLKWDGVVNNSGTTGYSDFKILKSLFMQGSLINLKLRLPNQKGLLLEI